MAFRADENALRASAGPLADDHDLQQHLQNVLEASLTPARQRKRSVAPDIERVCSTGAVSGFQSDALDAILEILTQPNFLDRSSVSSLIKSLYPAQKVSGAVLIRVVGALGPGGSKPPLQTQEALVRWLVLTYGVLEEYTTYSRLYGILFSLLDMVSLRAPLCHLLSLITRRSHVLPFRIQNLLELNRQVGNESALIGLIRVFKDYYPDIVVVETGSSRSVFQNQNPEWLETLAKIQEARSLGIADKNSGFRVSRRLRSLNQGSLGIPVVQTSRTTEQSVTLEEVENVEDFAEKLDELELPNQLASVLTDPLLQKYLSLNPSVVASTRINNWLSGYFLEQTTSGRDEAKLGGMLKALLDFTEQTKIFYTAAEDFLEQYLQQWDGAQNREVVLELASAIPLKQFEELQSRFLQPIEEALLDGTTEANIYLLNFYTQLLRSWGVRIVLQNMSSSSSDASVSLQALFDHVERLSLSTLESSEYSVSAMSAILSFYERMAELTSDKRHTAFFRICIPADWIVYHASFNGDLMTLTRLCGILTSYKHAFELSRDGEKVKDTYPRDFLNHFNGFLMDVCNCIWRNRAFSRDEPTAAGCLLPRNVEQGLRKIAEANDQTLPSMFSLSNSYTLSSLSIQSFRDLEDSSSEISVRHAGPVTQRSLVALGRAGGLVMSWNDYRVEVLRYLERNGVKGVGELMYSFVKPLAQAQRVV